MENKESMTRVKGAISGLKGAVEEYINMVEDLKDIIIKESIKEDDDKETCLKQTYTRC